MTLGEMKSLLKVYLNDPRGTLYDTDQLRIMLNTSMQFVYNALITKGVHLYRQTTSVAFVASSQEIALTPTDMLKPIQVYDSNLVPIPIYEEEFSRKSDVPSVYFVRTVATSGININRTDKLGWYRSPTTSFTLTLSYDTVLSEFDLNDSEDKSINIIPSQFHDVIVLRAAVDAWASKGIGPEIQTNISFWQSKFDEKFGMMFDLLVMKSTSQDEVVNVYED